MISPRDGRLIRGISIGNEYVDFRFLMFDFKILFPKGVKKISFSSLAALGFQNPESQFPYTSYNWNVFGDDDFECEIFVKIYGLSTCADGRKRTINAYSL